MGRSGVGRDRGAPRARAAPRRSQRAAREARFPVFGFRGPTDLREARGACTQQTLSPDRSSRTVVRIHLVSLSASYRPRPRGVASRRGVLCARRFGDVASAQAAPQASSTPLPPETVATPVQQRLASCLSAHFGVQSPRVRFGAARSPLLGCLHSNRCRSLCVPTPASLPWNIGVKQQIGAKVWRSAGGPPVRR